MVQNKIRKNQITREKIRKNKMKLENNYLLCCCLESVGIGKYVTKWFYCSNEMRCFERNVKTTIFNAQLKKWILCFTKITAGKMELFT